MIHTSETIDSIKQRLRDATASELAVLESSLKADTRKGVQNALRAAQNRIRSEQAEQERLESLYSYQNELAQGRIVVGLDEVGRGPLAGPLTVGAVILPQDPLIHGLNDSKKIAEEKRDHIANEIKRIALAWSVIHIEPDAIDAVGMASSLRMAFMRAIAQIETQIQPGMILLDGNPMHLDDREKNVIKGDSKCASIAAASVIAKVERDSLMREYAKEFPEYHFDSCKGYASSEHIEAIKRHGLTPLHRKTFCTSFMQESLF